MRRMISSKKAELLNKQSIDSNGVIVDENDREFNGDVNFTGNVSGLPAKPNYGHTVRLWHEIEGDDVEVSVDFAVGPSGTIGTAFLTPYPGVVTENVIAIENVWITIGGEPLEDKSRIRFSEWSNYWFCGPNGINLTCNEQDILDEEHKSLITSDCEFGIFIEEE